MIVDACKFCIPLYHGTSSLFVPSIMEFGLGGHDPISTYDAVAFLQTLLDACGDQLSADSDWKSVSFVPEWIAGQKSFSDNANFRHGSTYFTPSRACAESYALTNRLGSEFISFAKRVFDFANSRFPDMVSQLNLDIHPLVTLFDNEPQPVLITARGVPIVAVRYPSV